MVQSAKEFIFLFFVYSFLGWVMETIYMAIKERHLSYRGFLLGPLCPIYGVGLILITVLLQHLKRHFLAVFFLIIVCCSVLEYITSFVMEHFFHMRWWDYSELKFNLNGRICLETTIPFGIIGSLALYHGNPLLVSLIHALPDTLTSILAGALCLLFGADILVSVCILKRITLPDEHRDQTEQIGACVREELKNLVTRR